MARFPAGHIASRSHPGNARRLISAAPPPLADNDEGGREAGGGAKMEGPQRPRAAPRPEPAAPSRSGTARPRGAGWGAAGNGGAMRERGMGGQGGAGRERGWMRGRRRGRWEVGCRSGGSVGGTGVVGVAWGGMGVGCCSGWPLGRVGRRYGWQWGEQWGPAVGSNGRVGSGVLIWVAVG